MAVGKRVQIAVVVAAVAVVVALAIFVLSPSSARTPTTRNTRSGWISTGALDDPDLQHMLRIEDIVQVSVRQGRVRLSLERNGRRGSYSVTASEADICALLGCTVLADSVEPLPPEPEPGPDYYDCDDPADPLYSYMCEEPDEPLSLQDLLQRRRQEAR